MAEKGSGYVQMAMDLLKHGETVERVSQLLTGQPVTHHLTTLAASVLGGAEPLRASSHSEEEEEPASKPEPPRPRPQRSEEAESRAPARRAEPASPAPPASAPEWGSSRSPGEARESLPRASPYAYLRNPEVFRELSNAGALAAAAFRSRNS